MVSIRVATGLLQKSLAAMMSKTSHPDSMGLDGTYLSQLSQLNFKKLGRLEANKHAVSQLSQPVPTKNNEYRAENG